MYNIGKSYNVVHRFAHKSHGLKMVIVFFLLRSSLREKLCHSRTVRLLFPHILFTVKNNLLKNPFQITKIFLFLFASYPHSRPLQDFSFAQLVSFCVDWKEILTLMESVMSLLMKYMREVMKGMEAGLGG